MGSRCRTAVLAAAAMLLPPGAARGSTTCEGVSFAAEAGSLYLPVREAGRGLDWEVRWDGGRRTAVLKGTPLTGLRRRMLRDGTRLVAVRDLEKLGARVTWDGAANSARVSAGNRALSVRNGPKRVHVNVARQRMRAWQGDRLVLDARVSTGMDGHRTPRGSFRAGPYRARMHYSSLYNRAPMPYSVQVRGNIFIHGFRDVPRYRASRGCIRLQLTGGNPARWFYEWVDTGTPIRIADDW